NGIVDVNYLSARLPARAMAGAPPSRHKQCSVVSGTTTLATTLQRPCPVTDGNLPALVRIRASQAQTVTGVVVDLGAIRPVRLVVERGLAGQFIVEISSDGTHFHQVGTSEGALEFVAPPGSPPARYVRLREPTGRDESLMG